MLWSCHNDELPCHFVSKTKILEIKLLAFIINTSCHVRELSCWGVVMLGSCHFGEF